MEREKHVKCVGVLDQILRKKEIRLAVEFKDPEATGFPPEMYIQRDTGKPWGIGPILFDIIAADLCVEPTYVDIPWPDHIPALQKGEVDVILATNTPQRGLLVDFVDGCLMANRVVCLRPSNRPMSLDEINRSGVHIACWRGSSVMDVAKSRFPEATVVGHERPEKLVRDGEADVYVNDSITHRFLELNPGLSVIEDSVLSREYVHFAVHLTSHDLRRWLNNWYAYHHAQGTIERWCHDWWESFMAI